MIRRPLAIALAIAALAGSAHAATDDAAGAVLAKARAAFGDADAKGALVQTGAETNSGLVGRWHDVEELGGGRMSAFADFQAFKAGEVWTASGAYRQDHSGGVHPLNSGFARQQAASEMWLAARGFLHPAPGDAIAFARHEAGSDGGFEVLNATPAGGLGIELWFDDKTGLLDRSVWAMPTDIQTVRYADYRPVAGLMVPFKVVTDSGNPADIDTVAVEHADLVAAAPADAFVRPVAPDDSSVAGGAATVPISFDGYVVIDAMLNGKGPFSFILDTGGHDILTPDAAKALGLSGQGAGVAGGAGADTLGVQYTRVDKVQIGGATLRDQSFLIIPLQYNTLDRGAQPPLAGILGVELFERFAMRLDYHAKTLAFRPFGGAAPARGTPVTLSFTDDIPLITARINGVAGDNALDTGDAATLIVQGHWANANGLGAKMRTGYQTAGFGSGGITRSWASRADLQVAGVDFPRTVAFYSDDAKGSFSSRTEAGNIGDYVLGNFTLDFDYARGTVWFEPAPKLPARPYGRMGISPFKLTPGAFTVALVTPGSPGEAAGLKPGDNIVAVNGVPAARMSGADFAAVGRKPPGTKVTLDVTRGGQARTVVVVLRELLP